MVEIRPSCYQKENLPGWHQIDPTDRKHWYENSLEIPFAPKQMLHILQNVFTETTVKYVLSSQTVLNVCINFYSDFRLIYFGFK